MTELERLRDQKRRLMSALKDAYYEVSTGRLGTSGTVKLFCPQIDQRVALEWANVLDNIENEDDEAEQRQRQQEADE